MIWRWKEVKTDTIWHCIHVAEGDEGNWKKWRLQYGDKNLKNVMEISSWCM